MDIGLVSSGGAISQLTVTKGSGCQLAQPIPRPEHHARYRKLSFNPNAPPADYTTDIIVNSSGLPGGFAIPVKYTETSAPWFTKWGFTNTASNVSNIVCPGMVFTIDGFNFGPSKTATSNPSSGKAQTTLAKTQVLFDDVPAALESVVNTPTGAMVTGFAPFELAGKTSTQVQVVYNGVKSPPLNTQRYRRCSPGFLRSTPMARAK